MDKRDNFEEKIKAKLEEVSGNETDQAWQSFAPLLNPPAIPFWKHWSMPYLFASLLFLTSIAWHQWGERQPNERQSNQKLESDSLTRLIPIDTIYQRDTVYVVDTVYLYKKVYLNETKTYQPTKGSNLGFSEVFQRESNQNETTPFELDQEQGFDKKMKENNTIVNSKAGTQVIVDQKEIAVNLTPPSMADTASVRSGSKNVLITDLNEKPEQGLRRRSMAAASVTPQEKFKMKSEIEFSEGDTSNLNQAPVPEKLKPMFHIELGTSLLFPISKLVEYYTPNQQAIQIGLEWESGWGVYLGAIRNNIEGELDDEEILLLSPSVVNSLPDIPVNVNALDEIYFTNNQWFFPLELRWRSLYYNGFSFESSFGIMGNYLSSQDFKYEFENISEVEYQFASTQSSQFKLSHLRLGIGTNYLVSKRMGLFLRSHYWLPISQPGLIKDRMYGLEVGAGVNFMIGK